MLDNVLLILIYSVRALQKWKDKQGLRATYRSLLQVCCNAEASDVAEAVCDVLKLREEKSKGEKPTSPSCDIP